MLGAAVLRRKANGLKRTDHALSLVLVGSLGRHQYILGENEFDDVLFQSRPFSVLLSSKLLCFM